MDDNEDEGFEFLDEHSIHEHDVRGTCAFLRDCWMTMPTLTLGEILDEVFGGDIIGMSEEEIMTSLKEFLIQNE